MEVPMNPVTVVPLDDNMNLQLYDTEKGINGVFTIPEADLQYNMVDWKPKKVSKFIKLLSTLKMPEILLAFDYNYCTKKNILKCMKMAGTQKKQQRLMETVLLKEGQLG